MRLRHGEHNEELCAHLMGDVPGRFNDWAVTAAFYACIHFVEHALFPRAMEGRHFADFEEYCRYRLKKGDRRSRHILKADLVAEVMPDVRERYGRLKDTCMHARYKDYRTSEKKARAAQRAMLEIKRACLAVKSAEDRPGQ